MPKPLDDRLKAAMAHGARVADVLALVDEIGAEIATAQAEHDLKDAASKSVTVGEDEADALADEVAKLARKIVRLGAKRDQLRVRHEELQNSERAKRARAELEAITERRDALASDLKDRWPALCDEIVGLLQRLKASDEECGKHHLTSAEAIARDVPGSFRADWGNVSRFVDIRLPAINGRGLAELAWPIHVNSLAETDRMIRANALQLERNRKAEAERWKRYIVTPPAKADSRVPVETKYGTKFVLGSPDIFVMDARQVALAEGCGCTVELAKDNESIGLPAGVNAF